MKRLILLLVSMMLLCACDTLEVSDSSQIEHSSESAESADSNNASEEIVSDSQSDDYKLIPYLYHGDDYYFRLDLQNGNNDNLPYMFLGDSLTSACLSSTKYYDFIEESKEIDVYSNHLDRYKSELEKVRETTFSGSYCGIEFNEAEYRSIYSNDEGNFASFFSQSIRDDGKRTVVGLKSGLPCEFLDSPPKTGVVLSDEELISRAKLFISENSYTRPDTTDYACYFEHINKAYPGSEGDWVFASVEKKVNGICLDKYYIEMNCDGGVTRFCEYPVLFSGDSVTALPDYTVFDYIEASIKKLHTIFDGHYDEIDLIEFNSFHVDATPYLVYIPIIDSYAIRVELQYTVELKENVSWKPGTDHRVFYFPFDPKDYE
jgi:hypothetical protein